MASPYRPLLAPFAQVLPPTAQPKLQPKPKATPVATRPAQRTADTTPAPRRHPASGLRPARRLLGMCPKGHALTAQNSHENTKGARICSLCKLT